MNGKQHGQGRIVYVDGTVEQADWLEGVKHNERKI